MSRVHTARRRGQRGRPNVNPVLALMRDDDFGDPWGTGMSWCFAVLDNMTVYGYAIPEGIDYSPSPLLTHHSVRADGWAHSMLHDLTSSGEIDEADLARAAVLLYRYTNWCEAAGLAY